MNNLNKLILAATLFGFTAFAQADDNTFPGMAQDKALSKVGKGSAASGVSGHPDAPGAMGYHGSYRDVSGTFNGAPLSQKDLSGSYAARAPMALPPGAQA